VVLEASIFGIGLGEMVVIAAIALVVIGPERFPEFARIVVRTIRDVRGYVDEAKQELDKELRPITKEIRQLEQYQPKRYFDDITNKPKEKPKPKPVDSTNSPNSGDDSPEYDAAKSDSVAANDGGEPDAPPEEPGTTPYQAPLTEADFDRHSTAFPKPGGGAGEEARDDIGEASGEENGGEAAAGGEPYGDDEPYRD
jgi:sec-independent protein translocase protein TatB